MEELLRGKTDRDLGGEGESRMTQWGNAGTLTQRPAGQEVVLTAKMFRVSGGNEREKSHDSLEWPSESWMDRFAVVVTQVTTWNSACWRWPETHMCSGWTLPNPPAPAWLPVDPQSEGSPSDAPSRGFHPQETPSSPHKIPHLHIDPIWCWCWSQNHAAAEPTRAKGKCPQRASVRAVLSPQDLKHLVPAPTYHSCMRLCEGLSCHLSPPVPVVSASTWETEAMRCPKSISLVLKSDCCGQNCPRTQVLKPSLPKWLIWRQNLCSNWSSTRSEGWGPNPRGPVTS